MLPLITPTPPPPILVPVIQDTDILGVVLPNWIMAGTGVIAMIAAVLSLVFSLRSRKVAGEAKAESHDTLDAINDAVEAAQAAPTAGAPRTDGRIEMEWEGKYTPPAPSEVDEAVMNTFLNVLERNIARAKRARSEAEQGMPTHRMRRYSKRPPEEKPKDDDKGDQP